MITGWDLLEPARRQGARFIRAVVRFGEHAREVAVDQLEPVLASQIYQTDFTLDDPETENSHFDFVVWDADGRMWYRGIRDGLVELRWMWATPEAWLAAHHRALEILSHVPDVPPAPGDEMPDEIAAAIEKRVRVLDDGMPPEAVALFEQLADTPYDIGAVDAAARVYAAAVRSAGGKYGHALAAVWRAWHRDEDGGE